MVKFANKTVDIKSYQFTLLCRCNQVTHPKQQKSF